MAAASAREFTEDDLDGMLAFDRTPLGQGIIARNPVLVRDSALAGRQLGQEIARAGSRGFSHANPLSFTPRSSGPRRRTSCRQARDRTIGDHVMDIGFIGLGSMGTPMALNLVRAGHAVRVWNRSPEAAAAVEGAIPVASPAEAFRGDAVVTMLSDDEAVRGVIVDSGALADAPRGLVHVVTSTISVALVDELVALHRAAGIAYVGAPVFGRPTAAAAAQLNIVAAGDPDAIARVQPIFDALGVRTWRLGDEPHAAHAAKLAGNMMIALAIEAMAEATALTESYGVPAADFLEIVTDTLFASPAYKGYGATIASGTYEPAGFKLRLGLKDVRLAIEAGAAKGTSLPAAEVVRDALLEGIDLGFGEKDWSALAEVAHRRAGGRR